MNISGDLLWHNTLWQQAKADGGGRMDFAPQLASLREYVSAADLAVCHSEVPFAPPGGPYANYPTFAVPQEAAAGIAATGWDLCTTASNHTMDAGWDGLVRTLAVHRANAIMTSGSFATEAESRTPVIFTTKGGVRIAVISQTFGLNGIARPKGREWAVNLLDADATLAMARQAREAGADIVAVHMHAGEEYSPTLSKQQTDFATAVTASPDVDLVFGQHAHVVQPVDRVNGKWVFYGMGNLIAASGPGQPYTYDGYVAQVRFTQQGDGRFAATEAEFAPTMITKRSGGRPARVLLIPDELKKGAAGSNAMLESAARTRARVNALHVEGLTERG
ncbi:hypothetical protein BW730_03070 [Tessaracoccus aquimaris]|uniref:Capsule synthesis protein CapA domain-containing protein n=1 Tax=Tessaracoccus aquimaris TaxID=1332264 RepID=A0A1Q2CST4_9ACTN|nr:hypothetical protein BW730_03070 [Tessaracoccus aquimaris]